MLADRLVVIALIRMKRAEGYDGCGAEGGARLFDEASVPLAERTPVAVETLGQEHNFLVTTWSDGEASMR